MTSIKTSNTDLTSVAKKYTRVVLTQDKPSYHRLVENEAGIIEYHMGVGKWKEVDARAFRTLVRKLVQAAKSHQLQHLAVQTDYSPFPKLEEYGDIWVVKTLAENLSLAAYEFVDYKSNETMKDVVELQEIVVCGDMNKSQKQAFNDGLVIAEAMNYARDVINTSGADMHPTNLAKSTQKALKGTKATVKILNHLEIKKHKMGLLEAVGKGASDKPNLIVVEYWGAGKPKKGDKKNAPIALIGKGITFDSGGLNVKPSGYMHDMHMDMGGGGSVIGAMRAIAKLGLKKNVIALIPAAENAISADSMRAGDIATAMDGTTVEIIHTDAEGRLVLADALTYAQQNYNPAVMLDMATLTGAAVVALGEHTSAIMTKNAKLQQQLIELGELTGDLTWPLPLWDEYKEHIKSDRADIANIDPTFSRTGGAIEGGTFLAHFVKKTPWAHIDIAPRMSAVKNDNLAKGATGEPVRLLVEFVKTYK